MKHPASSVCLYAFNSYGPTANIGLENRRCKVLANAAERRTLPMARSSIMRHDVYSRRVDEVSTLPQGGGICTTAAAIMRLSHVRRSRPTWTTSMHTSSVPDWRHCLQPVIWCVMVRCLARTSTSLRRTRYPDSLHRNRRRQRTRRVLLAQQGGPELLAVPRHQESRQGRGAQGQVRAVRQGFDGNHEAVLHPGRRPV